MRIQKHFNLLLEGLPGPLELIAAVPWVSQALFRERYYVSSLFQTISSLSSQERLHTVR